MENLNTLLFKSLTQISKESRLVFKKKAPGSKPAATKPPEKKGDKPRKKPGDKPATGGEKAGEATPKALKAHVAKVKQKWENMLKASGHTAEFKATLKANIKQLEAKFKLVIKDGKVDKKKFAEFKVKLTVLNKRAAVATILDKKRRELLSQKNLQAAKAAIVKGIMATLPKSAPAKLVAVVKASINKSLGEIQGRLERILSGLAKNVVKATAKTLPTFSGQVTQLPKALPTTIKAVIDQLGKFPEIDKMGKEVLEYLEAVKIVLDPKKMTEFLGKCTPLGKCKEALANWTKLASDWLSGKKPMPKGKKLVEAILKIQSKIVMTQVFDWIKNDKNSKKLYADLLKALKKVPGALRGVDINIEAILRFLQNYASLSSTGAENKRKIAQLIAKAIGAVKPPLKVAMVVEGGADSQPITLSKGLTKRYQDMQKVAQRIFKHVKPGEGLRKLPQIKQYGPELTKFAKAADVYAFLQKETKNGSDAAAMKKWLGAGGVLNTLLFVSRSEDIAGELGSADNLFKHKICSVGGHAVTTGRAKSKDRYSRVSFIASNSKLRQSTVPRKPKKKKVPLTPKQKKALKLKESKDKLKAMKAKAERAKKSAKDAVKAIKNDPKIDPNNPQLKDKFSKIDGKIKEIDVALKPLPANATKAQIDARTAKLNKLIGELNKLVEDMNKLKTQLLAAKVPTKLPNPKPGKTAEYLGTKFKKTPDGKFVIVGTKHKLTEKEFKIVVGVERPDEAYKRKKMEAVYVRADVKPAQPVISYDPGTKTITGIYTMGADTLIITYNIRTGVRIAANTSGNLIPLLSPDKKKRAKISNLKAILKDQLDVDGIDVVADTKEAGLKAIKEHLTAGEFMDALKLLVDQPKKDIALITRCVERLALPTTNWAASIDTAKLKPLLAKIVENFAKPIGQNEVNALMAINGGLTTKPALDFTLAMVNSDKVVPAIQNFVYQVAVVHHPTNPTVAKKYLENAFVTTLPGALAAIPLVPINIKAIKAYTGDWKNCKHEVLEFIVANYTGNFDTPAFKAKIHDYLAAADLASLPGKYDEAFDKLYPNLTSVQTLATKKKGAEVWAKRQYGLDLMDTDADKLFTAGDANIIKFVDKFANICSPDLGTVNAGNKANAENVLKRIEKSTNPKTIKLTEELITALKALPGGLSNDMKAIEQQVQKRMKAAYDVATGAVKGNYENRVAALKMFLAGGAYNSKTVNGVPAAKGAQGASRDKFMRGLLANLHYDNEKFDAASLTTVLIAELPKERKEFVGYFKTPATLDEPGMKMIMGNRNKIGVEAIKALADKLAGIAGKKSQALRLYKVIGMKEKAAEMLSGVGDPAEEAFMRTLLDHVDKKYKNMTPAEREKVRKGFVKAYKAIIAAGTNPTSNDVQMRIIEQLFELGDHLGGTGKRDVLKLLDDTGADGHLNRLATPAYTPPTPPAKPTAAQLLVLRAKELRAKVELKQVKLDPNAITHTDLNQLSDDLDVYQKALGKKALEKDYVDTLKKIYIKKAASLTRPNKEAYARVMLKAAEAHKDPKYLVGGYGNANLDIKESDLTTDAEKVRFYVIQEKYLEAATHEPDNNKKLKLIEKSKKPKKEIADAYSAVSTPEGQYKAADKYIEAGGVNLATAKAIISRTTPPNLTIPAGRAETLINKMPQLQVKIDTAAARGLKKLAFKLFKAIPGSQIDVAMLTGSDSPSNKEVMNGLKGAKRKITPAGVNALKTGLLNSIKGLPEWVTLTPVQQNNVNDSLTT